MRGRIVIRAPALLLLSVFIFSIWSCRHSQEIRLFVGIHDKVSENSWVIKVDHDNKLVMVETVETKMNIIFKAEDEFLDFLRGRRNWIVPVTFYCNGKPDKNCNLNKPYTLYVATRKVKPVSIGKIKKAG